MIVPIKVELDKYLVSVENKISSGTVTCEDFNNLINKTMIGETTPEAVRDRLRRRSIVNSTESHIDNESGHQALDTPSLAKRVQPKRKPSNQQNHGVSKAAHRQSTRTQRRKQK